MRGARRTASQEEDYAGCCVQNVDADVDDAGSGFHNKLGDLIQQLMPPLSDPHTHSKGHKMVATGRIVDSVVETLPQRFFQPLTPYKIVLKVVWSLSRLTGNM